MTKFKVYPFLVSRNRTIDYTVVVAPDFMINDNQSALLSRLVTGKPTSKPIYRDVSVPTLGNIGIAYRVVRAVDANGTLKDEFGRPILWIEGFALKEDAKDYEVTDEVLDLAHSKVEKTFREFWDASTKFIAKPSQVFEIYLEKRASAVSNHTKERIGETKSQFGWTVDRDNLRKKLLALRQERENADRDYKIGVAFSIIGIPLIPVFGVGLIVIPIGGVLAWTNHQKRNQIDEQLKSIENDLRR